MLEDVRALQAEAQKHLAYWQPRLGLGGWDIEVSVTDTLVSRGAAAEVEVQWEQERATLRIMPPQLYRAASLSAPEDVEYSVVHELLHILLWPFHPEDPSTAEQAFLEQAVNRLTKALLAARRGEKKRH